MLWWISVTTQRYPKALFSYFFHQLFIEVSLNSLKVKSFFDRRTFSGISPTANNTEPTSKVEHVDADKLFYLIRQTSTTLGMSKNFTVFDLKKMLKQ